MAAATPDEILGGDKRYAATSGLGAGEDGASGFRRRGLAVADDQIGRVIGAGAQRVELCAVEGTTSAAQPPGWLAQLKIFWFATKNSIMVIASALLFSTLLCSGLAQLGDASASSGKPIPLGVPGFIVIGSTIAILGGRAVRFVSDRAAGVLGVAAARGAGNSDMTQIEGLGDEDIVRLAEDGVDSLHALAHVPLPWLLPSTVWRACATGKIKRCW